MNTDMSLQIPTFCELCTTYITFEWFLTSVDKEISNPHLLKWRAKVCENCAPHLKYWKGSFVVWIRTCVFNVPFAGNFAPQISHYYDFSPVWIRTCVFKLQLAANCAPQVSHLYGFSPVWIPTCFLKLPLSEYCAPHVKDL